MNSRSWNFNRAFSCALVTVVIAHSGLIVNAESQGMSRGIQSGAAARREVNGHVRSVKDLNAKRESTEILVKFRPSTLAQISLASASPDVASSVNQFESFCNKFGVSEETILYPFSPTSTFSFEAFRPSTRIAAAASPLPNRSVTPFDQSIVKLSIADPTKLDQAISSLHSNAMVEWAQANFRYEASAIPTESLSQELGAAWGVSHIHAPEAWGISQGEGVIVAVIDTGIQLYHKDLQGQIWRNPLDIPGNCIDDDNNGFIDDSYGADFVHGDYGSDAKVCTIIRQEGNTTYYTNFVTEPPIDRNGHGTHVAGTIAALGGNGLGVVGVAPRAKIMAIRGLDAGGWGNSLNLASGIVYAADHGARVINNSWGTNGWSAEDPLLTEAVQYAANKGVVVVFAAGNSDDEIIFYPPANISEAIAVAAVDERNERAYFSNFGHLIDVAAPGVGITSSFADYCQGLQCETQPSTYAELSGTSMAAPHVAGVAALILSKYSSLTSSEVRQILRSTAKDLGDPGFDPQYGAGLVNAENALHLAGKVALQALEKPLKVELSQPLDLQAFSRAYGESRLMSVRATIHGDEITSYTVDITPYKQPFVWRTINSGAVRENMNTDALLTTVNLATYPADRYLLRVQARGKGNQLFDDYRLVSLDEKSPKDLGNFEALTMTCLNARNGTVAWSAPDLVPDPIFIGWYDRLPILYRRSLYSSITTRFEPPTDSNPYCPEPFGPSVVYIEIARELAGNSFDLMRPGATAHTAIPVVSDLGDSWFPRTFGNTLTWASSHVPNGWETDIKVKVGANGAPRIVKTAARGESYWSPSISGATLLAIKQYSESGGARRGSELVTFNYLTPNATEKVVRSFDPGILLIEPVISGDRIAWIEETFDTRNWYQDKLVVRDLVKATEKVIATSAFISQVGITSSGVYFLDLGKISKSELLFYSFQSGKTTRVTQSLSRKVDLSADDYTLAWVEGSEGDWHVKGKLPSPSPSPTPTGSSY